MMSVLGSCSFLLLLVSLSLGAPVDKAADVSKNVNEVQEQEQELQSLLQLADEKSARDDVTVHEEHVQHVHEVNGHKVEVDTARKTISDTQTGQVLSDVKQEVSKGDDSADAAQPEVEVKTEVDVPAEGVHETIVQSGNEEVEQPTEAEVEEAEVEEEFSPEAVAEYLYRTGDFNRFYSALAQLVNASIMTEDEAQSYSQLVALEYDRMQMEDYENSILVQRRVPSVMDQYPVAMETPNMYPLPLEPTPQEVGYPVPMETPEALYGLEPEPSSAKDLDVAFDPYELLYALWNEAYGTGDVRAEALVSELFDKVRDDSDPDDEGQVRDILLDLIANSLANDEMPPQQQPLYGWQPIADPDTAAPIEPILGDVVAAPAAAQPMAQAEDEEAANELMAQGEKRAAEEPTLNKENPAAAAADDDDDEQPEKMVEEIVNGEQSEEDESGKTQEEEQETNDQVAQPAPAPVSAQKRTAETV